MEAAPSAIAGSKDLIRAVAGQVGGKLPEPAVSPALAPWASLLGGGAYALLQDITGDLIADTARRLADQRASPEGIEGLSAFFEKRPPVRWRKHQLQCRRCFRSMCVCARVRVCGERVR